MPPDTFCQPNGDNNDKGNTNFDAPIKRKRDVLGVHESTPLDEEFVEELGLVLEHITETGPQTFEEE